MVLEGDVFDEACASRIQAGRGDTDIPLFILLMIWTLLAGQGSIAMEIIKELPTVDYILVPIGGGGLCTGVSTLAKMLNPKIKVIGVEPAGASCMKESLEPGKSCNPSSVSIPLQMVLRLNVRAIRFSHISRKM